MLFTGSRIGSSCSARSYLTKMSLCVWIILKFLRKYLVEKKLHSENKMVISLNPFLILLFLFKKIIVDLWDRRDVSVSVHLCVCCLYIPPSTFECLNQSLWNLVRVSCHLSLSQLCTSHIPPVSLCVCMWIPLSLLLNLSVKTLPRQQNTCNNGRIAGRFVFNAVHVVSKESRRLVPPRTSCL
jgi:hypothetical protein